MSANTSIASKRIGVAVAILAFAFTSIFYGGIAFALFLGFLVFFGIQEFVNIARAKGLNPPLYYIIFACFLLLTAATLKHEEILYGLFIILAVVTFLIILFRGKKAALGDVSMTILSILYAGAFPIHSIMIRNFDTKSFEVFGQDFSIGFGLLLLMFLVIPACDIAAYYTGKLMGKHPLWRDISPKKTVEGSLGGAIAGIAMSVLVGNIIGISLFHSTIIGLILCVVAQLGDLSESMIKREVGVKDSGTIFLGHGGVLDRSDSYIFNFVAAYYYFKFFIV